MILFAFAVTSFRSVNYEIVCVFVESMHYSCARKKIAMLLLHLYKVLLQIFQETNKSQLRDLHWSLSPSGHRPTAIVKLTRILCFCLRQEWNSLFGKVLSCVVIAISFLSLLFLNTLFQHMCITNLLRMLDCVFKRVWFFFLSIKSVHPFVCKERKFYQFSPESFESNFLFLFSCSNLFRAFYYNPVIFINAFPPRPSRFLSNLYIKLFA